MYVCLCMYVCMYICMYECVCMYLCMCVCLYVCIYVLCVFVCVSTHYFITNPFSPPFCVIIGAWFLFSVSEKYEHFVFTDVRNVIL